MATIWQLAGDSSGVHYVNAAFIESVVTQPMSPSGIHSSRIRTVSGKEYYAYFPSASDQMDFLNRWSTEYLTLDAEPAPPYSEAEEI